MLPDSGELGVGIGPVVGRYQALVAAEDLTLDPAQLELARRLDRLGTELAERKLATKTSRLGRLFGGKTAAEPVRGLYVHGAVGRGKTMLMDAFYATVAVDRKRRTHFHAFMADVHDRIHAVRAEARRNGKGAPDPITPVAAAIAETTRLLCLDEFAVEDIADAMILSRLFEALFARGLVLVATSNVAPENLYRDGLNRGLFLPFIAVLRHHVDVVELGARTDYRLDKLAGAPVYVTPLGPEARAALDRIWRKLTGEDHGMPAALTVKGRTVAVPEAAGGVARFPFTALCEAPLGAGDYAEIARSFHTVLIDDIPVIAAGRRDVARRFINLIDVFYDHGIKLVASAAAEPEDLYRAPAGKEAFAFRRTVSRLIEMRSEEYLAAARHLPARDGDGASDDG
ncbi:MAG: AFG1 family ATPase [Bauldia sp.]|nr:AFG1 family ATPase [Bauldia sp.]